jgi:hypothetical protein
LVVEGVIVTAPNWLTILIAACGPKAKWRVFLVSAKAVTLAQIASITNVG